MKISIVIPVYNAEKYLKRTIDSLTGQTLQEIQLIFVNDGSTDGSLELLNSAAKLFENLIVIDKKNGGVSSARNAGLLETCGEYIGFVDADDTVDARMYEILYDEAIRTGADIVSCGHTELVKGRSSEMYVSFAGELSPIEAVKNLVMNKNIGMSACTKIFKREIVKDLRFDEEHKINEDRFFVYEAIKRSSKVAIIPMALYYYYQNEGSATHAGFSQKNFDWFYFSNKIYNDILENYAELEPYSYADKVKSIYYIQLQYFESGIEEEQYHKFIRKELKDSKLTRLILYVPMKLFLQICLSKYAEPVFRKIKGY